eukprot:TRINITY_DN25131_c0_g5_i1.p1 TRINITY_DN25131_c0_g5~~TRINITY_DN25131_c0_g5_i1.p1  ORF type:complete len:1028 (-),score=269.41 TRINITY_DN25131_c0_g5_i1:51-3134(-)
MNLARLRLGHGAFAAPALLLWLSLWLLESALPCEARSFLGQQGFGQQTALLSEDQGTRHEREVSERIEVRRPATDKRRYTQTTFDSGLKVLVVTDPDAEKAAFAVAVSAGSLEDPEDFQGLAHFCEHMLFLGSEKYPNPDTFTEHLATYGGNHNAYTSAESTVYFNEITYEGLERGLDIFAQFFVAPSFNRSMVNKEIHAVDSEHRKNMPDVSRKLWHLLKSRASRENPMHKFATGDLDTLKTEPEKNGKDLVEALRHWHKENYCSSRLRLVMVGRGSADEQLSLAHRAFDAVPASGSSCQPRPVYLQPGFSKALGNVGERLTLKSLGSPELWVQFPTVPRLRDKYRSVPEAYLLSALGHYGEGGLKAALLKEDLCQSFSPMMDSSVAGTSILVRFALTEKGQMSPERVLHLLFGYLNAVKKAGVDEALLKPMQQWRQVHFDYQAEPTSEFSLVQSLAGSVSQGFAPEDLLTGGVLMDKLDPELSMLVLNSLDPRKMNVAMLDPSFDEGRANRRERFYDTKYLEEALGNDFVERLAAASAPELTAPPALRYVPTKLELVDEGSGEKPELLEEKGRVALWWQGINAVRLPKGLVMMKVGFSKELTKDVAGHILAMMHARLVRRILEGPSDELQMCGLSYNLHGGVDSFSISFSGFDQHMEALMRLVLPAVRAPVFSDDDFEAVRRQAVLDLADSSKLEPYQHAMSAYNVVTVQGSFDRQDLLKALQDKSLVNAKAYRSFLQRVIEQADIKLLVAGNLGRQRARGFVAMVEESLHITREQAPAAHVPDTRVLRPNGSVEIRIPNPIGGDPNSATMASYQVGIPTIEERVKLMLLGEIIQDPVFMMLRTTHQLGYVVFGFTAFQGSVAELRILVQGFRKTPDAVELLIESAARNVTKLLAEMAPEEVAKRRRNARLALTKRPATLDQEAGRSWEPISKGHLCFDRRQKMLEHLDAMGDSAKPVADMWASATHPSSGGGHRVIVKLFGGPRSRELVASAAAVPKVVTMLDAAHLGKELAGEEYWPDKTLCE